MQYGKCIDTAKMDSRLRARVINMDKRQLLVARLEGSAQEQDLTLPPNCEGYGRIRHFRRRLQNDHSGWPDNPLPIRPAANWLSITEPDVVRAQVFQLAGCSWRCWFCYVPFELLTADPRRAKWLSARELVELYMSEPDPAPIIDLSGGSPDLAPEWISWMMDEVESHDLTGAVYLWSDDNLSSDRLLQSESKHLLCRIERYGAGYGRVCCLKGFDDVSFAFNTNAEHQGFEEQLRILAGYAETSLDLYLYLVLTSPRRKDAFDNLRRLVDRLQKIRPDLLKRTVPLQVLQFSPMRHRLERSAIEALAFQSEMMNVWIELCEQAG